MSCTWIRITSRRPYSERNSISHLCIETLEGVIHQTSPKDIYQHWNFVLWGLSVPFVFVLFSSRQLNTVGIQILSVFFVQMVEWRLDSKWSGFWIVDHNYLKTLWKCLVFRCYHHSIIRHENVWFNFWFSDPHCNITRSCQTLNKICIY